MVNHFLRQRQGKRRFFIRHPYFITLSQRLNYFMPQPSTV